jgi:hypothetical protein
MALLQGGEEVSSVSSAGGRGDVHITIRLNGAVLAEAVAQEVGRRGGDVQLVLGTS